MLDTFRGKRDFLALNQYSDLIFFFAHAHSSHKSAFILQKKYVRRFGCKRQKCKNIKKSIFWRLFKIEV